MAASAERLPVALVSKEFSIAAVRDDVIGVFGRRRPVDVYLVRVGAEHGFV